MSHLQSLYERSLIDRLKTGDMQAFSVIFSRYYKDLLHFSLLITHDKGISEELVQDIFLKMWENRSDMEVRSTLKSYLLASVQNRSIDILRHKVIEQRFSERYRESPVLFTRDTENYILHSELEYLFKRALDRIPAVYGEVFRMSRMEGIGYREIAAQLEVSERTVEVRMSKALQLLREELKDFLT